MGRVASALVAVGLWTAFYPEGRLAFDDSTSRRLVAHPRERNAPTDENGSTPVLGLFFWGTSALTGDESDDRDPRGRPDSHGGPGPPPSSGGWWWVLFGPDDRTGPGVALRRRPHCSRRSCWLATTAAPVRVGIWAAVGAGLKVWPVLVLCCRPRRRRCPRWRIRRGSTAVMLAITPAWAFDGLSGFLGGQGQPRGPQVESVGALPFLVANPVVGGVDPEYRYGSDGGGPDRCRSGLRRS